MFIQVMAWFREATGHYTKKKSISFNEIICVVSLKTRIVRILFSCMLPQTDNCCPTTVYRHLQCMSLLIDVSGVLRRHYMIEPFYDRKLWFLLWCLSLLLSLNSCFFIVYFRYILECDIL